MPDLKTLTTRRAAPWLSSGALALALALTPGQAVAQQDRQAQSVSERNAPEFTRRPIRVGSFDLFASIDVDADFNDNIFALPNNEVEDVRFLVEPRIVLSKRRPDQTTRLELNAGIRRYVDAINENSERFSASLNTRQGVGSGTVWNLGVSAARSFEQRRDISSFNESNTPINFNTFGANAGVSQDLGALRLALGGRARLVRYSGAFELPDGSELDLSFRDLEVYSGNARASFAQSRNSEIYLQVEADTRRFNLAPLFVGQNVDTFIDRSSKGGRIELGYRRQLTELLYLDVRGGYLLQDFDDPTLGSIDGLAFNADLLWNATALTSVRLTGVRRVDSTIDPRFSGLVRTEANVAVEHELMRNILLIGRVGLADFDQTGSPLDGQQYVLGASAEYRLNPLLGLRIEAERFDRSGLNGFDQNSIRAGITYNF